MNNYTDLDPKEDEVDKQDEIRIWQEIGKIDGASEYFRTLMSRDMKLHFVCPKEQQDLVRGGFYRTEYFANQLKKNSTLDRV